MGISSRKCQKVLSLWVGVNANRICSLCDDVHCICQDELHLLFSPPPPLISLITAGMAAVAAQAHVHSSTITQGAAATNGRHNCDSMMDLTRKHFYKQGERQCVLDMFN